MTITPELKQRRNTILQQMSAREAPRILLLFVAIIILFDIGYALIGIYPPIGYYVSDAIQSVVAIVAGLMIIRGAIPPKWVPATFASVIVVNNIVLNYQYTIVGYGAVGVILLLMASYGAITLMWRPFLISAALMASWTTYVLIVTDEENGPGWAVTMFTALAVSGVVLYGRQRGALALAEANKQIEEMATSDALTGLLNRHGLEQAFPQLDAVADRHSESVFAVFFDITGLKQVNDVHGHAAGDLVISRCADALRHTFRESDAICRWGGDEFVVVGIGPEPDPEVIERRVLSGMNTDGLDGVWTPSVWAGSAQAVGHPLSLRGLIESADEEMYARRSQ